jgi:4-alpha-glucanotransferase
VAVAPRPASRPPARIGSPAVTVARSSGIQLHITSLPSGRLGGDAYAFVDWLASAGQSWWQVLPLGPPDELGSPYRPASAFAGSTALLADPGAPVSDAEIAAFRAREAYWIEDWARIAGGRAAIADQVRFDREWAALRTHAAARGVRLIGDVPLYVAPGSADHRAHRSLFQHGVVAGAPPDAFSRLGQRWGNPLYDWPALRRDHGYRWWVERLRRAAAHFDLVRIDHFRGFVAYWSIPARAPDARGGRWRRGPGRAPFDAARRKLGSLPLIAEDLGAITPAVLALRDALGLPGMVVLQFSFETAAVAASDPIGNAPARSVLYTGTHDHPTVTGWWAGQDDAVRARVVAALRARGMRAPSPGTVHLALIRLAFSSPSRIAMIQLQDALGFGDEARMNVPGQVGGNWNWRVAPAMLTAPLARRLRRLTRDAGRLR